MKILCVTTLLLLSNEREKHTGRSVCHDGRCINRGSRGKDEEEDKSLYESC